eukprot:1878480-Pyramimonas_sp.AAC.1
MSSVRMHFRSVTPLGWPPHCSNILAMASARAASCRWSAPWLRSASSLEGMASIVHHLSTAGARMRARALATA